MNNQVTDINFNHLARIIFCMVLLEFLLFIFSEVSFSFLSGDPYFNIAVDPLYWFFYLAGIPQFIISHYWMGIFMDCSIILLLILLIRDPFNHRLALMSMFLLGIFYLTITGYLTHRNYQAGFIWVFLPFIFKKPINRSFAFETARYFLLIFYTTAGCLKLSGSVAFEPGLFSNTLMHQFTPYYLDGNTGIRTSSNIFLIKNHGMAHFFYWGALLIELTSVAGFFTKRFDKIIAVLLLIFHFSNWFIMDIAPIGQISFIALLFLKKSDFKKDPIL